ncbi:MAG: hypothetical protein A3I66_04995 [Burkholderiales bacterium RIFCSPLOWO2_02_FULL_57_36]|nr:MAG: hypothetical protein A3I66_04995 [Burkholderiales bacterium RIFCSPLOWO2_02_FULL_57_36]
MMPIPCHFLVVDDQPITQLIITALLNGLGYTRVSEAADGLQALSLIRSEKFLGIEVDFVITDWNMPAMNGLTLLRTIRASGVLRHLPVLMITADTKENCADVAIQARADGFLDKQMLNAGVLKEQIDRIMMKRGLPVSK